MSGGVPRGANGEPAGGGRGGTDRSPHPFSPHLRSARSFEGYPNWCPSLGCSSCGAQGALSPPPPVSGPAGWPATQPPFTLGVVHPRGGEPLMVGSHSVVPRCGAGGAPRLVGSHIAWGTTPCLALPGLAHRVVLSFPPSCPSHRLAGSDRLTTTRTPVPRLPHQRWGLTRRGPSTTRGVPRAPHRHCAQSLLRPCLRVHQLQHSLGYPMWSPGCGAPQE